MKNLNRLVASLIAVGVIGAAPAARAQLAVAPPPVFLSAPPLPAPASAELRAYKRARLRRGLMAGLGFGSFAAAYLPLAGIGIEALASHSNDTVGRWFMAPIFGPFIVGGQMLSPAPNDWFADLDRVIGVALICDGLIQAAGLVLGVVGAATIPSAADAPAAPRVTLAPLVSPSMAGLSLTARF